MVTKTILVTIRFDCHHWMEIKKGGIWQTPFCLFQSSTRMGKFLKYGLQLIVTTFQMATKVF
jgi:hypothetical protein